MQSTVDGGPLEVIMRSGYSCHAPVMGRRRERPKSESLNLRVTEAYMDSVNATGIAAVNRRLRRSITRGRPNSDLGKSPMARCLPVKLNLSIVCHSWGIIH